MLSSLRMPILFAILTVTVAIYENFPFLLVFSENYFLSSLQPIITIILLFYLFEKTNINKIETHYVVGVIIVVICLLINLFI